MAVMSFFTWSKKETVEPLCAEDAVYAAMTYALRKKVSVRIVISKFEGIEAYHFLEHAQAQALIDGKWCWLVVTPNAMITEGDEELAGQTAYGTKVINRYSTIKGIINYYEALGLLKGT